MLFLSRVKFFRAVSSIWNSRVKYHKGMFKSCWKSIDQTLTPLRLWTSEASLGSADVEIHSRGVHSECLLQMRGQGVSQPRHAVLRPQESALDRLMLRCVQPKPRPTCHIHLLFISVPNLFSLVLVLNELGAVSESLGPQPSRSYPIMTIAGL